MRAGAMAGGRVRSEQTWAAARAAYLGGAGGAEVCERFDLGLSTLRLRARRENWRRSDEPDPAPGVTDDEDEVAALAADPPTPGELAAQVWVRAAAAVGGGRLREAQGWTKLWRELTAAAGSHDRARRAQAPARAPATSASTALRADDAPPTPADPPLRGFPASPESPSSLPTPEVHSVHSVHPVPSALERAPPLNRAERRRLERLAGKRGSEVSLVIFDRGAPTAWLERPRVRDEP